MAGILTHLIMSNQFLAQQDIIPAENRGCFMLGNCFPDVAYWPGEYSLFSDLAHYLMAAELPELIYKVTDNSQWQAFALGWLFHLKTDAALHPLINKFAAQKFYKHMYDNQILTYEENKIYHALIENSFDRQLMQLHHLKKPNLTIPDTVTPNPVEVALNTLYPIEITSSFIPQLMEKLPRKIEHYLNFVYLMKRYYSIRVALSSLFLGLRFLLKDKTLLLRSFVDPPKLKEAIILEYSQAADMVIADFDCQKPEWFSKYINFDTGRPSMLGEYGIADNLFYQLDTSGIKASDSWIKFRKIFKKGE